MNTQLKFVMKRDNVTWDQMKRVYMEVVKSPLPSNQLRVEAAEFVAFSIEKAILDARAIHLFMPNLAFCNWLVACVSHLEEAHVAVVANYIHGKVGCMHFPTGSSLTSFGFLFSPTYTAKGEILSRANLTLSFSRERGHAQFLSIILGDQDKESENHEVVWYAKLIVGLGLYLACFPEQVHNGIPEDLKHANYYKGQQKTISIPEKLIVRDGPTPHYRVGHFRMLQAERFTHKRGQVVFVEGCFVKGKAETVVGV